MPAGLARSRPRGALAPRGARADVRARTNLIPLPYAILLHILVAFPSGRLSSRAERVLVAASYLTATVVWWALMLLQDTTRLGLPPNHLLAADKPDLFGTLANVRLGVVVVLIALTAVVLMQRWDEASSAQRRALAPVYVSGGLVLALYAVWSVSGIAGAPLKVQENLERARVVALATVPFAFLAGLLRSRVAGAAAVSALVATLGDGGERRGRLRGALAQALGDPSLELVFWLPERGGWVDAAGAPVQLPGVGSTRTSTVIEHDGRPLATIIHDVSLAEEADRGLGPALEALATRVPVPVELAATPEQRLPATIEAAVYYVVSEALTNVTRYAQATEAQIAVTCDDGEIVAVVADDGIGGADPARGSGLRGLTDRVAALDGRLEVESPEGRGTTVRAVIPAP